MTLPVILVLLLGLNLISGRYQVHGQSMVPTLTDGEFVLASKVSYWFGQPQRGDVVVVRPPQTNGTMPYIKRIIGLPGERVTIRDGRVFINGVVLNEPYVSGPPLYNGEWLVGEGAYFILGDNRNNSSDSHAWGTLTRDHIIAKAILGYWPLDQMGFLLYDRYPELMAQGNEHE